MHDVTVGACEAACNFAWHVSGGTWCARSEKLQGAEEITLKLLGMFLLSAEGGWRRWLMSQIADHACYVIYVVFIRFGSFWKALAFASLFGKDSLYYTNLYNMFTFYKCFEAWGRKHQLIHFFIQRESIPTIVPKTSNL